MNTNSELDRIVSTWLEDRVAEPPHGSLQSALARADLTPQQHHRWLQWWFGRGRGATGSAAAHGRMTPTTDRRNLLMFSAIAATAAAAALALVAMLTLPQGTVEPEPPPAAVGSTWSVAATGGDFSTISEAVEAASDGDTILIEPGLYEEAFTIDKDITLAGNGKEPQDVVIHIPMDAPTPVEAITPMDPRLEDIGAPPFPPVGIQLIDTGATLSHLQVIGQDDGIAVLVRGGVPTLDGLIIKHDGDRDLDETLAGGLYVDDGSRATVRDSTIWHRVRIGGGSTPTFEEGNVFQYARITIQGGSAPVIEDSTIWGCDTACDVQALNVAGGSTPIIRGNRFHEGGIVIIGGIDDGTSAIIEGNTFVDAPDSAISVQDDAKATIEGNTITGNQTGISISHSDVSVRDNELAGNHQGIVLPGSSSEVVDNRVVGGDIGVIVDYSGAPSIDSNSVEGATVVGVHLGAGTKPTVIGNRICGSKVNLLVEPAAKPTLGDNDICPDGAAMAE